MAVYKCKICGANLEIKEAQNIVTCDYCDTKQTVPNVDDDKKINLFNRANRLRMACEFDKASALYENIVAEFPDEAEGYWGLMLCNYGIEYVDDLASGKKMPTCHRASFESMQKDENYALALKYADINAQKLYRDEAKRIDDIMSEILSVSRNEQPYDVFICYKETDEKGNRTIDSVLAQDIYNTLTEKNYKVFFSRISLETKLGKQYEPYIFAALNSAKVMLAVGTEYEHFQAVWVKNEWSRFLKLMAKDKSKTLIPCYKDMDIYDMPEQFQKLQAQDLGKVGAIQDLLHGLEKLLKVNKGTTNVGENVNAETLLKRISVLLEESEFQTASEYCNRVLDMIPMDFRPYWYWLLSEFRVKNEIELEKINFAISRSRHYANALRFAPEAMKKNILRLEEITSENEKDAKQAREKEKEELEVHCQHLQENISDIQQKIQKCKKDKEELDKNCKILEDKVKRYESFINWELAKKLRSASRKFKWGRGGTIFFSVVLLVALFILFADGDVTIENLLSNFFATLVYSALWIWLMCWGYSQKQRLEKNKEDILAEITELQKLITDGKENLKKIATECDMMTTEKEIFTKELKDKQGRIEQLIYENMQ